MEKFITCFERVLRLTKKLPEEKFEEAVETISDFSFQEFLDFCVENHCFTEEQAKTLHDGTVMWEGDENYSEEDPGQLRSIYNAVGVTEDVFERYAQED